MTKQGIRLVFLAALAVLTCPSWAADTIPELKTDQGRIVVYFAGPIGAGGDYDIRIDNGPVMKLSGFFGVLVVDVPPGGHRVRIEGVKIAGLGLDGLFPDEETLGVLGVDVGPGETLYAKVFEGIALVRIHGSTLYRNLISLVENGRGQSESQSKRATYLVLGTKE